MTTLGKLLRTTAFQVSVVSIAAFAVFAVLLVLFIGDRATDLFTRQVEAANDEEIRQLDEVFQGGGLTLLINEIATRSLTPGASLYLIADPNGRRVVGNVGDFPLSVLRRADASSFPAAYSQLSPEAESRTALVRVFLLPGGFRLLVGRDVGERQEIWTLVRDALSVTAVVLITFALATWWFLGRRVFRRVDAVAATTEQILAGDLSRRIAISGTGDEFDRLAASLNAMLARIEQLMTGLKEVSDNIAHDLKTPLTRMRNRVEAALRAPSGEPGHRDALETTLEESDHLIRTFDALLLIARVEAAAPGDALVPVDAAEVLSDVAELYEPVAEEAGLTLELAAAGPLPVKGNRELISQALANLIDNAVKYAGPAPGEDFSPERRVVRLSGTRVAAAAGARVELRVTDRGPGIAPADRERAAQRFVRLETSRSRAGSGLGLSLVAAVARLHGGRLVLGEAGPGLDALIDLPAAAAEEAGDGRHAGMEP